MNDYPSAAQAASGALKEDPQNVKALYRRGLARNHLGTLMPDLLIEKRQ